jgi:putative hydrolase of the HAD superfamily
MTADQRAPRPRAILFDLDDTILSAYGRPEPAWLAVLEEFTAEIAPLSPMEIVHAVQAEARGMWGDADSHRHWRMQLFEARRETVARAFAALASAGRPVPGRDVAHRIADRFSHSREEQLSLFPDAHAVVDALKARGLRLALVTNGEASLQRAKVDRFDLAQRFDHIQIEGEHGFGKPEERAYVHAMEALGVTAAETWMVGDNLEWEVVAPQRLGIYAVWHDHLGQGLPRGSDARPDLIIRSLGELLPAVERALAD